jgi:hypothetical protein
VAGPDTLGGSATLVSALFRERTAAERAFRDALDLGYKPDDINVLLSEETRERLFPEARSATSELASKASESTETASNVADELGGPAGGTVGTIAPAIAAIGTALLVPGLGILAAGPVAVALTAAGAVGVTGGLIGALTNWGIPKRRVQRYEEGIRSGGILLAVRVNSQEGADELQRRWMSRGGERVED